MNLNHVHREIKRTRYGGSVGQSSQIDQTNARIESRAVTRVRQQ